MKWLPRILLAMTLVICLGCGSDNSETDAGSGKSSPEETVRGYIKAMEALDAEKVLSYFIEVTDFQRESIEYAMSETDKIIISNLDVTVISQTDNNAEIETKLDSEATAWGETNKEHQTALFQLEKVNGEWLIREFEIINPDSNSSSA